MRNDEWRFWLPLALLVLLAVYSGQKLIRAHVRPTKASNAYVFTNELCACRGSIYDATGSALVKSIPVWDYHLDPVALTNAVVLLRDERGKLVRDKDGNARRRSPAAIMKTVSDALGIDYPRLMRMSHNTKNRFQSLGMSTDPEAHRILSNSRLVAGLSIKDTQVRRYLLHRRLSHVLGSVNADFIGSSGIELKYNKLLTGTPGTIRGMLDGGRVRRELYDKRIVAVDPVPGDDIYLTVDHTIQYEAETALADGVKEFGAETGWCVVMDARNAAVLALASLPDFDPLMFGKASDSAKINRVTSFTYEPGSVMKVITAAAAFDAGFTSPGRMYSTERHDDRYYRLPGDGTHKWEPYMSVGDAVVHSSNIVIGKLGYDFGPKRLWEYMTAFGFGKKTGIELPGEEVGILRNWSNWDKATWSRAPIGQGVSVTAIQLASAYQAIANDGKRMQPHIVSKIVDAHGDIVYQHVDREVGRPVSPTAAKTIRDVMQGVATKNGTARRAALRGYSVAGKTGTAQKARGGSYVPGLYRATFIGIVPANDPKLVILVTLDFDQVVKFHQGGNSSAVVFRRLATAALRYLMIPPDKPDEIDSYEGEDEFDRIMDERSATAEWND